MGKIVIAGGTGFIGSYLQKRFRDSGYTVLVVSRDPEHISWKPVELSEAFEGAELIINLAGKSINCRHNDVNKKAIIDSRINTTLWIGNAIKSCEIPPKLWINASAAGIYRPSFNQVMTEDEPKLGTDFQAEVVTKWEKTFFGFQFSDTRQVALRTSVVLGRNGGALKPLILLAHLGLGGKQGGGKQQFSWVHMEDYFRILLFLLNNESLTGFVNCTAPTPVSNNELMFTIRRKLHVLIGLPAPKFAIQIGAKVIGTEPDLILNSSYVVPKRLLEAGFNYFYPTLDLALNDLLRSH